MCACPGSIRATSTIRLRVTPRSSLPTLPGLEVQNQVIYSLSVKNSETIGISVYTSAKQGMVSVDMAGGTSNWTSLVSTEHRICDQMEVSPPAGEYQIKLTCADADGQLYVFVKRNGEGR